MPDFTGNVRVFINVGIAAYLRGNKRYYIPTKYTVEIRGNNVGITAHIRGIIWGYITR
jgi:hypothetical protein